MANYSYPIDLEMGRMKRMNKVIKLWNAVEEAYEKGSKSRHLKKPTKNLKR